MSKIITSDAMLHSRKAHVYVMGCKVNQAEIDSVVGFLMDSGFEIDHDSETPEIIFVNTCCVTDSAAGKSRRMIRKLAQQYPASRLLVSGCLAEIDSQMIKRVAPNADVLGTYDKDRFQEIIFAKSSTVFESGFIPASSCLEFSSVWRSFRPSRSRAFLKVQDGCSHRCSYCIVPIARGPSRSMNVKEVINNVRDLVSSGFSEIALTGVHLGAYGRDLTPGSSLDRLVSELLANTSNCRFRLSSIEPQDFSDGLLRLVSQSSRICRHFHIPTQSGDDEILKRMFRPYKTGLVRDLADKILDQVTDACLGMDIMVGFPGESDSSFQATLEFVKESRFSYFHVFPFSPRKGTVAYGLPLRTPNKVARSRVKILRSLSNELRAEFYKRFVGRTLEAVVESVGEESDGWGKALTDNYISVNITGLDKGLKRKIIPVMIHKLSKTGVIGSLLPEK
jgi:threonylcarbamoyladenosine tRNA methylthiotransferase MtaB